MRGALNLNISSKRQLVNRNAGPAGFRFLVEDLSIDFVHRGKVLHVRQEDVDFDDVANAASGGIQHCAEIGQRLSLAMISA